MAVKSAAEEAITANSILSFFNNITSHEMFVIENEKMHIALLQNHTSNATGNVSNPLIATIIRLAVCGATLYFPA